MVRTDNSAMSCLHRSKDPVGQPARWIEVIDTYDNTGRAGSTGMQTPSPGSCADTAEETARGPQPKGCRQCPGVRDAGRVGPRRRWPRGKTPILISAPSCNGSRPGTTGPVMALPKVLWRQWERLHLVRRVLHRRFHELEGQGWRHQLVVPEDRRKITLQHLHGGAIGAHLGTAHSRAGGTRFLLAGDASCTECDCAMLKRQRGRQEPLHQYIVGVPMEHLAMDVAGPYPITSTGNQYCLG